MKNFCKKSIALLLSILFLFFAAGCSMDKGDDDDTPSTGTLSIQISNSISKALKPSFNLTPSEYIISGSSDADDSFTETIGGGIYSTELEINPGVWTLSIVANNADSIQIGSGSTSVTVTAGQRTTANLAVTELSGNGTLNLSVEWPAAEVTTPGIGCYVETASGATTSLNFTINEVTGTAVVSSGLPAGFYTLYIKLQDGVNVIPDDGAGLTIDGIMEKNVRIIQGQTTSGSYEFVKTGSFITTWDTTQPGITANDSIALPLYSGGTYDFIVSWGDGEQSHITSNYDGQDLVHEYAASGTYTVQLTGWIRGFSFLAQDDGGGYFGDSQKLTGITKWGTLDFGVESDGSDGTDFYNCTNMTITATDVPNFEDTLSVKSLFSECSLISSIPNIDQWDTSNITDMSSMFKNSNLDQSLGDWDVSSVTDMTDMLTGVSLSNGNYDSLLVGWNALPTLQNDVVFDAGNSYFETAFAEHGNIISTYNWTINDSGIAP